MTSDVGWTQAMDSQLIELDASALASYVSWRYGLKPRQVRRVEPERLRTVVGLLANSGVLYPDEVGAWLRSRRQELSWARRIVILRHRRQEQFDRVVQAAEATVNRLNGRMYFP